MKNYLYLGRCAYLYHWSGSNIYYGTKETNELHKLQNTILKKYYDSEVLRNEPVPYEIKNDNIVCNISGVEFTVNPQMIDFIFGDYKKARIINGRKNKKFSALDGYRFMEYNSGNQTLYSHKYNTLFIDNYNAPEGLGFYRLHYKNSYIDFILCDSRIYNPRSLEELQTADIMRRLNTKGSTPGGREICRLLNYLMEV